MDPIKNPFAPGAGHPPPALVGRDDVLKAAAVCLARIREQRAICFIGLRGVGKTVLLNKVQSVAGDMSYHTISFEADDSRRLREQIIPRLRQLLLHFDQRAHLNDRVKRGLRVLASFAKAVKLKYGEVQFSLDFEPETGVADSGDLASDLPELLVTVGEAAQSEKCGILVAIDEMQNLNNVEMTA